MSYLVFARKWRPTTFDDVVGQEHITGTLKKAIEKDRVAHAYIFSGTRGVGKTTTARILARALNCEKGPTPNPCGVCDSCKGISAGSSFDVLEIDGASNNKVEDIRELRDNVGYSSMGGKYRIFVIDEVHMLTSSAFNALLKTLEEPPPGVIFIFATTEPQKIPATIHSRCQRYDFRRIVPEQVCDRLKHICDKENIASEKAALMIIARKAEGSMRDALSLLDQVCSYNPDTISEKEVRQVLGLVDMEVYGKLMNAVADKNPAGAVAIVQEVLYQGFDLHEFALGLEEHLRNLLFSGMKGALESTGVSLEPLVAEAFRRSAGRFAEGDLLRMLEIVRKAENELKWSALPRFAVEMALLKMVFLDSTVSLEQLLAAVGGSPKPQTPAPPSALSAAPPADVKKKIEIAAPVRVMEPPPPAYADEPPGAPADFEEHPAAARGDVRSQWPAFIEELQRNRPNIGTFLSLATVAGSSESTIDLCYPSNMKFQFGEMTKKHTRDEIVHAVAAFMGRPIEVHITLAQESAADGSPRNYFQTECDPDVEHDPVIKSVLDIFDGEIIR